MYDPQYYLHCLRIVRSHNSQFYLRYISSNYKSPLRNNIVGTCLPLWVNIPK
jgi:hypothetical protein